MARITLKENVLVTTVGDKRVEEAVKGPEARQEILRTKFGIELNR